MSDSWAGESYYGQTSYTSPVNLFQAAYTPIQNFNDWGAESMSSNGGVFSFPSAGLYEIEFFGNVSFNDGFGGYAYIKLERNYGGGWHTMHNLDAISRDSENTQFI